MEHLSTRVTLLFPRESVVMGVLARCSLTKRAMVPACLFWMLILAVWLRFYGPGICTLKLFFSLFELVFYREIAVNI